MNAHAFWTVAPGVGEIRSEALPPPAPGQRRVRTLASADATLQGFFGSGSGSDSPPSIYRVSLGTASASGTASSARSMTATQMRRCLRKDSVFIKSCGEKVTSLRRRRTRF